MLIKFILFLIALEPRHELNRDHDLLAEVEGYFVSAGEKYGVEPSLIAYQAYKESSIRIDVVGKKKGEKGYCQAHGKARRTCEAAGYDILTRKGGAFCIALLLDLNTRYCGSLEFGLARYASGSCYKAREKMKKRLESYERLWEKIQRGKLDAAIRRKRAMERYLLEKEKKGLVADTEELVDRGG